MTAVNIIRDADAIHVVTDGLGMKPADAAAGHFFAGVSSRIEMAKVSLQPHLRCAIAVRGLSVHLGHFLSGLPMLGNSFDDMRDHDRAAIRLEPRWREMAASLARGGMAASEAQAAEIYFAGYSEREKAFGAFAIVTDEIYPGVRPFRSIDLGAFHMAPLDLDSHPEFAARAARIGSQDNVDALAVDLITRQMTLTLTMRERTIAATDNIGAFVQVTTLTRDAITTRIVHRW